MDRQIDFYHAPNTRSGGTLMLLEELEASYDLHLLDIKAGEQRLPAYLAINPMGKVPAIRHGDVVVTEQVAVFLYLAELYPEAGLSPALGDPLRGGYVGWMAFYAGCFGPALLGRALQRAAPPTSSAGHGEYETMMQTLIGPV